MQPDSPLTVTEPNGKSPVQNRLDLSTDNDFPSKNRDSISESSKDSNQENEAQNMLEATSMLSSPGFRSPKLSSFKDIGMHSLIHSNQGILTEIILMFRNRN